MDACRNNQSMSPTKAFNDDPSALKVTKMIDSPALADGKGCVKSLAARRASRRRPAFKLKLDRGSDIDEMKKNSELFTLKAMIANSKGCYKCNKIAGVGHDLYPIVGNGTRIYAHPILRTDEAVLSFWQLIRSQNVNKVVSLQKPGWYPSFLPDPAVVGSVKTLSDGSVVRVRKLSDLAEHFDKGDVKNLEVEITYEDKTKVVIEVDQIFNWPDGGVLSHEHTKKVVAMLPDDNCQVHCEGGLGRTGTLIVIKQLSLDNQITKENMLEKIADVIARSRTQRGDDSFVQTDEQLRLIVEYVNKFLIN